MRAVILVYALIASQMRSSRHFGSGLSTQNTYLRYSQELHPGHAPERTTLDTIANISKFEKPLASHNADSDQLESAFVPGVYRPVRRLPKDPTP